MNLDSPSGSIICCREPVGPGSAPNRDLEPISSSTGEETRDYFLCRERAERAAAKQAESILARRLHQELASAYAKLARDPEAC